MINSRNDKNKTIVGNYGLFTKSVLAMAFALQLNTALYSQEIKTDEHKNYVIINKTDSFDEIVKKAANVTPSKRQYEWQRFELTGFIHFGINTFDDVEWGKETTDISKFNPAEIDVKQWVKTFKDASFKLIILTAKHHDGFCLWPSKYTDYNISQTPFQKGKGDIVRDLSVECRNAGIKFGVYLSPWDIHEETYGTPEYNKHFVNQLTELLTNYGEIAEVWFDGACGEGPNGKKQVYDWESYYKLIRRLQPEAVIAVMGDDVRWVGTESGYGRQTEWSVLPGASSNQNAIADNSQQQAGDGAFVPRNLMEEDLGSREKIRNATSLIWYPAEIDVSIRPGWFYHKGEDELVKSPYKLVDIYYNSVGLNGVLLLNIPPDKQGRINENDVKSMQGMRHLLDETFKVNLAAGAKAVSVEEIKGNESKLILDNDLSTYWKTNKNTNTASIELSLKEKSSFNCAMLQENILAGQRVEKFRLEYFTGSEWKTFANGTTIGYKRLLRFAEVNAEKVKIVIEQSRTNPTIASFGLFSAPPELSFVPEARSFGSEMSIKIASDIKDSKIYYTLDGTVPDENSRLYSGEIKISETSQITAVAVADGGKKSLPVTSSYHKSKYKVEYKTPYSEKYPASETYTLTDGVSAAPNFNNGKWQGFNGTDVDVVIDLNGTKSISKVSMSFLRDINSYIFLPESLEFSFSEDGINYTNPVVIKNDVPQNENQAITNLYSFATGIKMAKYIHIVARNIGTCPKWHKGAGDKAWLFTDEITVE